MQLKFRQLLFLAIMLGLLAGSYFLVFTKRNARQREQQARIDSKLHKLADLQRATAEVHDVDRKLADLQKATAFFESKLPQATEIDKVLKEVTQLTKANDLQSKSIKTFKSRRMNGYREQPIEMNLSGNFNGFYQFLLQLEALPRLTRVTKMDLTKISDREGDMQAQVTLSIFFEPDTDAVPN